MIRVVVLGSGTSQGVPIIGCTCHTCTSTNPKDKRLRASVYVETQGKKILIDTSIDFRQQLLRAHVTDLDAILFTHHHVDHIFGLDDLRQINQRYKKFVDVYGNPPTLDEIKQTFRYALDEKLIKYMAVPLMHFNYLENKEFETHGVKIMPIEVMHGKIKIFGYRIGNFAYITDASFIPDAEMEKLQGLDVLILNSLRHSPHPTHFSLKEATDIALQLKPKQAYFTHITHDLNNDETNATLPDNIQLAYDGLEFTID